MVDPGYDYFDEVAKALNQDNTTDLNYTTSHDATAQVKNVLLQLSGVVLYTVTPIGIFLNFISAIVFGKEILYANRGALTSRRRRGGWSDRLLLCLAIADGSFLVFLLLSLVLFEKLIANGAFACMIIMYFFYSLSRWMVVAISYARLSMVRDPCIERRGGGMKRLVIIPLILAIFEGSMIFVILEQLLVNYIFYVQIVRGGATCAAILAMNMTSLFRLHLRSKAAKRTNQKARDIHKFTDPEIEMSHFKQNKGARKSIPFYGKRGVKIEEQRRHSAPEPRTKSESPPHTGPPVQLRVHGGSVKSSEPKSRLLAVSILFLLCEGPCFVICCIYVGKCISSEQLVNHYPILQSYSQPVIDDRKFVRLAQKIQDGRNRTFGNFSKNQGTIEQSEAMSEQSTFSSSGIQPISIPNRPLFSVTVKNPDFSENSYPNFSENHTNPNFSVNPHPVPEDYYFTPVESSDSSFCDYLFEISSTLLALAVADSSMNFFLYVFIGNEIRQTLFGIFVKPIVNNLEKKGNLELSLRNRQ